MFVQILEEVSLVDKLTSDLTAEKKTSISKISRIFLKNQVQNNYRRQCEYVHVSKYVDCAFHWHEPDPWKLLNFHDVNAGLVRAHCAVLI